VIRPIRSVDRAGVECVPELEPTAGRLKDRIAQRPEVESCPVRTRPSAAPSIVPTVTTVQPLARHQGISAASASRVLGGTAVVQVADGDRAGSAPAHDGCGEFAALDEPD
jgi:hypothetical protein